MKKVNSIRASSRSLTLGQIILISSLIFLIFATTATIIASHHIRDKAINDLSKEEARQISKFVFMSLYAGMRMGWERADIDAVVSGLNRLEKDMSVRVVRGDPVIRQYGDYEKERIIRENDPLIQKVLSSGEEFLEVKKEKIRFIYPIKVEEKCLKCHTKSKAGDINGVIDISFPVKNLKVSLSFIMNAVIITFATILLFLSVVLYYKLRLMIVRPISQLVKVINEVAGSRDLTRRVDETSRISEINELTRNFNRLLSTLGEYHLRLDEFSVRDPLTGLYNRTKFQTFVDFEIKRIKKHGGEFSLVMVDLDHFAHINDQHGHPMGDLVLKDIALFLEQQVQDVGIVARMGNDEFAILLTDTFQYQAQKFANELHTYFTRKDFELPVGKIRLYASLGLVSYPDHGESSHALLSTLGAALHKAKRQGRNRVETIDPSDKDILNEMYSRSEFLRAAIREDRVVPFFEPIINLKNGNIYAYEVLARIRDGNSLVRAGQFIEIAEEMGLAETIDTRVFEKVLARKREGEFEGMKLFFNLSAQTLANEKRMRRIPQQLRNIGVSSDDVVFELTERQALPHMSHLSGLIDDMRSEGISFALDDFGSGFSSFMYLKYLSVNYIKIEGSFVKNIAQDKRDLTMVRHISHMAQEFGLQTIAEYVGDKEVDGLLNEMGVDFGQGYYYSEGTEG